MPKRKAIGLGFLLLGVLVLLIAACAQATPTPTPTKAPTKEAATPTPAVGAAMEAAKYAGSEKCFGCHPQQYNGWKVSGHPYKLRPVAVAKLAPLPLPKGVSWDDVSYVIGGYKWKARYMDKDGFIITSPGGEEGQNQYNMMTGTWSDYHPGEEKPYDCGKCHTTGYSEEGHQDGLEGIVGTWVFPGIQCERCHGPGAEHVAKGGDKALIEVNRSAKLCGQCHVRGDPEEIPAKGGFIRHHEQYNELLASPHKALECVSCHNPHQKAAFSIKADCTTCHAEAGEDFAGSTLDKAGLSCADCHMPLATKSAVALGEHKGDVKTHLFRINTDAAASMFTEEGAFAKDFVTLDFACLGCHPSKDIDWAVDNAEEIHTLGKP